MFSCPSKLLYPRIVIPDDTICEAEMHWYNLRDAVTARFIRTGNGHDPACCNRAWGNSPLWSQKISPTRPQEDKDELGRLSADFAAEWPSADMHAEAGMIHRDKYGAIPELFERNYAFSSIAIILVLNDFPAFDIRNLI